MNIPPLTSGGIMLGIGTFFGVVLALADRYLRVQEDPRIDVLEELLPGTNCGACGQPGTDSTIAADSRQGQVADPVIFAACQ